MTEMISCIMPTWNRRNWVPLALKCWQLQDWPAQRRELIVIDDGDPVGDLLVGTRGVTYVHYGHRMPIGTKLNLAVDMAMGDLIAIWNDDDWHAPWRLRLQRGALDGANRICGTDRLLYLDLPRGEVWRYEHAPRPSTTYLVGGTMMFRREFWQERTYKDIDVGEDTAFIAPPRLGVVNIADDGFYVGTIHQGNVSPKSISLRKLSDNWRLIGTDTEVAHHVPDWWIGAAQKIGQDDCIKANDD